MDSKHLEHKNCVLIINLAYYILHNTVAELDIFLFASFCTFFLFVFVFWGFFFGISTT